MNTAYGKVEDLPFDLRQHLALSYKSAEKDQDRATRLVVLRLVQEKRGFVSAELGHRRGGTQVVVGVSEHVC